MYGFRHYIQSKIGQRLKRLAHIESRILTMGITLSDRPAKPRGNYIPFTRSGNLVFLAGHLPQDFNGRLTTGRLGETLTVEEGQQAARLATIQMLSTLKVAVGGDLDNVKKVVKIVGFVSSAGDFVEQATVMNGCSNLLGEVFGEEVGGHARSSVATNVLPLGVPIEIEGVFEVYE